MERMMQTNLLETLQATFEDRQKIFDLEHLGNYTKAAISLVVLACLFNVEHIINVIPLMRSFFTLVGLGVVIWYGGTKERRESTKSWILAQVDRVA